MDTASVLSLATMILIIASTIYNIRAGKRYKQSADANTRALRDQFGLIMKVEDKVETIRTAIRKHHPDVPEW